MAAAGRPTRLSGSPDPAAVGRRWVCEPPRRRMSLGRVGVAGGWTPAHGQRVRGSSRNARGFEACLTYLGRRDMMVGRSDTSRRRSTWPETPRNGPFERRGGRVGGSSAGQALLKKGPERFGIDFEVPARAQGRLSRRYLHKTQGMAVCGGPAARLTANLIWYCGLVTVPAG